MADTLLVNLNEGKIRRAMLVQPWARPVMSKVQSMELEGGWTPPKSIEARLRKVGGVLYVAQSLSAESILR